MRDFRPGQGRGGFDFGWLRTRHSFSFGDYHDPARMGFRALRVINEDWVQGGQGFGTHPHRDMEIFTWVLEGSLEHRDSLGSHGLIQPGLAQVMSAGTGILHSEFNGSPTETTHLLQIWILPEAKGLPPRYGQQAFPPESLADRWALLASRDGAQDSVRVFQDMKLWASRPSAGTRLDLPEARYGYLHVAKGKVRVGGEDLVSGDALCLHGEGPQTLEALEASEVLWFDLA